MTNPLLDVLPPRVRKYLYALLFLGGIVYAAYQAAGHDWGIAIGSLLAALLGATAHANTDAPKVARNEHGVVDLGLACLVTLAVVAVLWWFGVRPH